jgi:hypothetical protein
MTLTPELLMPSRRVQIRFIIPSAIHCFFHVYEERIGTYGLRSIKHVLAYPGQYARVMKTGCRRTVGPHEYVSIGNDISVDRSWCRGCAEIVREETRRGHLPDPPTPANRDGIITQSLRKAP